MEWEYHLLSKKGTVLPIRIQEESKEEFKELMGWTEEEFKRHSCRRFKLTKRKGKMK